jgi:hypothetical protein
MIKFYAVSLALGVLGLIMAIFGGALAENLGRPGWDPGERFGLRGKQVVGALAGFGMGGMSAEYSPLDLVWPASLAIALVAAGLSIYWVRYAVAQAEG